MKAWVAAAIAVLALGCGSNQATEPPEQGRWIVGDSGTEASLRAVSVVDESTAWASGSAGTVLTTSDGGETWNRGAILGAESLDFRDVHAWDANRAGVISAGLPAKVYLTEDGGVSWVETYSNETEGVFFNSMAFWDETHGIAVGDPMGGRFMLIETRDGGRIWSELAVESRPEALSGEANFAASGTCLTVQGEGNVWFGTGGAAARVFRSDDWGASWQATGTPLRTDEPSQGVYSVLIQDEQNGIVVGGDWLDEPNAKSNAALTLDGGENWILVQPGPGGFRECVVPMGEGSNRLMTVGPTGADVSDDGGLTWRTAGEGRFHSVDFSPNGALGVAVGAEGLVATWERRRMNQ